ncbi:ABC transporter G family member 20, partial [Frankliniella fusca]
IERRRDDRMPMSDVELDAVDPWSPGYVTPASTPSPRSARPCTPGRAPGALKAPAPGPSRVVAVSVRDAHHQYSQYNLNSLLTGKPAVTEVLKDFNMTVQHGNIYALLGSSGCGKTTVLRALVGQHKLTAGRVRVFGMEPRSRDVGIPGPSLGYMPQELAVPDGFTIRETLNYFGWLAGMTEASIEEHAAALLRLLDLPPGDRLVSNLSGGQQRRVSLAVALLHSPPLLILDEPTVGVDPIVRQSIWEHLLSLTSSGRTTVIITTHYIEEARQAHVAGLMRRGALLAEDSPDALVSALSCTTLEEVLLRLCLRQDIDEVEVQKMLHADGMNMAHELEAIKDKSLKMFSKYEEEGGEVDDLGSDDVKEKLHLRTSRTSSKVKALLWKNFMWIWRHRMISAAFLFLPAVIALAYNGGVGRNPRDLMVAVVDRETDCAGWAGVGLVDCAAPRHLSCIFLDEMRAHSLRPVLYADEAAAEQAVFGGHAWGMISFGRNFSDALVERAGVTVSVRDPFQGDDVVENSAINVRLDMSRESWFDPVQTIGQLLQMTLSNVASKALEALNGQCQANAHMIRPPIQFNTDLRPTDTDPSYLDTSLPGFILSVVFMFAFTTTMSALLPEKTDKILERSLVYGVRMAEVLMAQFTAQLPFIMGQITLVLLVAFCLFGNLLAGPVLPYVLLVLAQGVCGMWYGLLTAVIFDSTTAASLIGTGSYFTLMFMSSMLWPLEGMHMVMRPIATIMPMTSATISLRNIALRAWNLCHP